MSVSMNRSVRVECTYPWSCARWIGRLSFLIFTLWVSGAAWAQGVPGDADFDGIPDVRDNCVYVPNQDQHDDDQDLYGDVCDPDLNNDGIADLADIAEFKRLMGTGDLEPDMNGDGQVDYRDLGLLNARLGQAPGPRGATAAELDPIEIATSSRTRPIVEEIDGPPGFGPRSVGRLAPLAPGASAFDFVLNELVVIAESAKDLSDLLARWNGTLMTSFDPAASLGIPGPGLFLVQIDPSGVDFSSLPDDLADLDPKLHGNVLASDDAVWELLSVAVQERLVHGVEVGLNPIMGKLAIDRRTTREAAATMGGVAQPGGAPHTRNAFEWTSHEVDPDLPGDSLFPVDTGAAEAWRILDAAGLMGNRSRAMIWDGGFWPNADFPPFSIVGALRTPNTDPTGCGTGSPAAFGSACEAHGTHVVEAGWALPDNDFGTAGPGGPVTDLTLLSSPAIDVAEIVRFILESVPSALASRPDVINISAGFDIPAGWCVLACPPLNLLTNTLTNAGMLIVAAGGNDNQDVDAEDQVCVIFDCIRFESSTYAPCELDDVLCVGATNYDNSGKASYSNWGTRNDANSIDIWAPGNLWSVDARAADLANRPPNDALQIISGTSFATPFVAGVGTLVNSARPSLDGRQIRDCLVRTAHGVGLDSRVDARIDAVDAVRCATGGRSHPFVRIAAPIAGASFQEGLEAVSVHADADDREDGTSLSIDWSSSLEGYLVTTTPGVGASLGTVNLRRGTHVLTASVTDSSGLRSSDSVTITITNPLPTFEILSPASSPIEEYYAGQTIDLVGRSSDPNETPIFGPLDDGQVRWRVDGILIGSGHTRSLPAGGLSLGYHSICFDGTDDDGAAGDPDCVHVLVVGVPTNLDPVVTVNAPTEGRVYTFESVPVRVDLGWTAEDPEEGSIPFAQTRVLIARDGGGLVDRTADVDSRLVCSRFMLPYGCVEWSPQYYIDLMPTPSQGVTDIRIRIEARDTAPAPDTGVGYDDVNIEIYNFF